jgi:hypothetical protein
MTELKPFDYLEEESKIKTRKAISIINSVICGCFIFASPILLMVSIMGNDSGNYGKESTILTLLSLILPVVSTTSIVGSWVKIKKSLKAWLVYIFLPYIYIVFMIIVVAITFMNA